MKRYFSGLAAVVIAVAALAFTFPTKLATSNFQFLGDPQVSGEVSDVTKWQRYTGTINCPGTDQAACIITGVDEVYYDNSFNLNVSASAPEQVMSISESPYTDAGLTTYFATSPASGSVDNKNR